MPWPRPARNTAPDRHRAGSAAGHEEADDDIEKHWMETMPMDSSLGRSRTSGR